MDKKKKIFIGTAVLLAILVAGYFVIYKNYSSVNDLSGSVVTRSDGTTSRIHRNPLGNKIK